MAAGVTSIIDLFDLCDNALIAYIAQYSHPTQLCFFRAVNRRMWALIEKPKRMRADTLLTHAARGGWRDLCLFAIAHGAIELNWLLIQAAKRGHRNICLLAIARGANSPNWMLADAARGGHRAICDIAIAYGATDFNRMLVNAAGGRHHDLCELAIAHGA